uniref:Uncharacterized protein n=1 Tax=Arundo donax TaxID=35708 RepID=A0A0A8Z4A6_ARUDO
MVGIGRVCCSYHPLVYCCSNSIHRLSVHTTNIIFIRCFLKPMYSIFLFIFPLG